MFRVNNKDIITWRRSGVFIVNFEHISLFVLVFSLLTLSRLMSAGKVLVGNLRTLVELVRFVQKLIQNPVRHLRWSFLRNLVMVFNR